MDDEGAARVTKDLSFSPGRMVLLLAVINAIMNWDRGVFSSTLSTIEDDLEISNTEGGALSAAYTVGYTTSTIIYGHLFHKFRPMRMLACGLMLWMAATIGCGFSWDYYSMLVFRCITGVGDGSIVAVAPVFLNAISPAERKSKWLATFFMASPVGMSVGAGITSVWLQARLVGEPWQFAYFFESLLMLPCVVCCLSYGPNDFDAFPEIAKKRVADSDGSMRPEERPPSLSQTLTGLFSNPFWVFSMLGSVGSVMILGGYSIYQVQYEEEHFGFSKSVSGLTFSIITAFDGIIGPGFGGMLVDRLRRGKLKDETGSVVIAMKVVMVMTTFGFPSCMLAFTIDTPAAFFVFITLGRFFLYACLTPTVSAILWALPPSYRAFGVSLTVALGNASMAVAPLFIGMMLDALHENWRLTFFLFSTPTGLLVLIRAVAFYLAWGTDRAAKRKEPVHIAYHTEHTPLVHSDTPVLAARSMVDDDPEVIP